MEEAYTNLDKFVQNSGYSFQDYHCNVLAKMSKNFIRKTYNRRIQQVNATSLSIIFKKDENQAVSHG